MHTFDPLDSLVPIFRETTIPRGTKQIATSVFIKNDMGCFLFTAAHVTDDLEKANLLVPVENHLQEIDGYFAHIDLRPEISRSKDDIDFAYFKLSTPFTRQLLPNYKPITGSHIELIESSLKLHMCSLAGYPTSKGKKKNNVFSSEIFVFSGMTAEEDVYNSLNLSHSSNIVFHFNRKKSVDTENGKPFTPLA